MKRPSGGIRAGIQVEVESGGLKGKKAWVATSKTETGREILTIQQRDPGAGVMVCETQKPSPFIGYLCGANDLGAARSCSECPAD